MIKTTEKQQETKEYLDEIWEECDSKYGPYITPFECISSGKQDF